MPDCTYIAKEEKSVLGFKAAKDCLTHFLGRNAGGGYCKVKPPYVFSLILCWNKVFFIFFT
jgi:hypothetical protein